jgi:hypothetical protein
MANNSNTPDTIKQALDAGTDALDPVTLAKLRRVRQEVLEHSAQSPQPVTRATRWWLPVGAVGATTAAALVAVWIATTVAPRAHVDTMEDIDILASADNTDLYEQMDFYEWLDSQQGNKNSNAG